MNKICLMLIGCEEDYDLQGLDYCFNYYINKKVINDFEVNRYPVTTFIHISFVENIFISGDFINKIISVTKAKEWYIQ